MSKPYWADANLFIQAANNLLSFKRAPKFWTALAKHISNGDICSSQLVYAELVGYGDELSKWISNRKHQLCLVADEAVQRSLTNVADHVASCKLQKKVGYRYDAANRNDFLAGADPWLIAHVMTAGGTLVTHESRLHSDARKVRIPDVCAALGVRCVSLDIMMDELGIQL